MNIGFYAIAPSWGGSEVHTVQTARALKERGHNVAVVCLTSTTYKAYRAHCPAGTDLVYLPIPKDKWHMTFADWLAFFPERKWDVCVLVKGMFVVGNWKLDLAARWTFGNSLTIEHLTGEPNPPKTS